MFRGNAVNCENLSNCIKSSFLPVMLVIIVTGSMLAIGFKVDLDEATKKQLGAFIVDAFTAALALVSSGGKADE
jgi:hypothetical protein